MWRKLSSLFKAGPKRLTIIVKKGHQETPIECQEGRETKIQVKI